MDMTTYQTEAAKTLHPTADIIYLAGKLACEATEILQPLLKMRYHGKEANVADIIEELGDLMWYVATLAQALDADLSDIAEANIAKLRERHGESYNPAHYVAPSLWGA